MTQGRDGRGTGCPESLHGEVSSYNMSFMMVIYLPTVSLRILPLTSHHFRENKTQRGTTRETETSFDHAYYDIHRTSITKDTRHSLRKASTGTGKL